MKTLAKFLSESRGTKYLGVEAKKSKPTKDHRPGVWENMLGTVYAMNHEKKIKYFHYDHEEAKKYAGVHHPEADPRLHKVDRHAYGKPHGEYSYHGLDAAPRHGKTVLWVKKHAQ